MIPWALPGPSAGTHLDPPDKQHVYSLQMSFSLALSCSQTFQNQPHPYTEGTGDKPPGRGSANREHFLPTASRPSPCQSPAKEQAQSGLKNHFAILCLVAISTAETRSTRSKLKQDKKQHKATKPRVESLKPPNHIQSLLILLISHRN